VVWQAHHRAAVSYRYGIVFDAVTMCNASVTTNARDSARLDAEGVKFGANLAAHAALSPKPFDSNAPDTWVVAPSENAGFGQIKSRPFAWKRMDGSTMLFKYGEDTVHLKQWNRPSVLE
jgi:hypothetical protein